MDSWFTYMISMCVFRMMKTSTFHQTRRGGTVLSPLPPSLPPSLPLSLCVCVGVCSFVHLSVIINHIGNTYVGVSVSNDTSFRDTDYSVQGEYLHVPCVSNVNRADQVV